MDDVEKDARFIIQMAEYIYCAPNVPNPTASSDEMNKVAERMLVRRDAAAKLLTYRCAKCKDEGCGFCGRSRW